MKARNMFSKVLAAVLAVLMLVGLVPAFASAEGTGDSANSGDALDNLVMNKTARLEDDGTYTITLEAYAKGEVQTTVVKQVVPTDVILVLDQSGSMEAEITGIPGDTYTEANPTNQEVVDGYYYYQVGDKYYRVTATKEIISKTTAWVGQDRNKYTEDQLSSSWTASNGKVYNTPTRFVTTSLKTYTRHTTTEAYVFNYPHFINDDNSSDDIGGLIIMSMSSLREEFMKQKKTDSTTVAMHNDGIPSGVKGWQDQDPYYVAAVYIAVTQQTVNICRYTYTYVDDRGRTVTIGQSEELPEAELDAAPCAINPLYTRDTKTGTRLEALQYAANRFIDDIRLNALANGVDHRVAVIGFASSGDSYNKEQYENTELFVGATQYRYGKNGNSAPSAHYTEALQSAGVDTGYANLQASIQNLDYYGGTHPQYGFEMANGVFANNSAAYTKPDGTEGTRSRVIIFMTDGEPGSGNKVDTTEANATIANASISKDTYQAKVYSVAVQNSVGTDQASFLSDVSSNATYTLATSAEELESFFSEVSTEITGSKTTVDLTKDAILVDTLSNYFVVPADFSLENNVKVKTATHVGDEAFLTPTDDNRYTAELVTGDDGAVTGISVTGFDYVTEQVTTSVSSGGSTNARGSKLVVEIKGLLAKDSAAVGTYINTNTDNSGIWDKDADGHYGMIKAFPMPTTLLDRKTIVLDYAKDAQLDVYNATRIDSANDLLFSKVGENSTSLDGRYGLASTATGNLTYTPKTMNWDGYDTFYALGKDNDKGDPVTKNIWTKVSVVPANNIYYEDTFVTNNSNGTVGITYTGDWSTAVTPGGNTEDPNGDVQGWIKDLFDDTDDSDGTIHMSSEKRATAEFTFTGTGFDVYSRTNLTSGKVYAKISWTDGEGNTHNKGMLVDTESASGEYYSIPTLWFSGEYATYTVKITVQNDAEDNAKYSYCIDGIRIYNPLNPENRDENVTGAYGNEVGATFLTVRQMLIDAKSLNGSSTANGFVFIDKTTDKTGAKSNEVGTFVNYGPKNEVYLAPNQAIAFYVGEATTSVQIGLKSPEGKEVIAHVSNGVTASEFTLTHTTDLYYEAIPDNGYVVISNESQNDELLSVTKVKFMVNDAVEEATSIDSLLDAVDAFDAMPVVLYNAEPEEFTPPEVEIENPDPEPTNPEPDPEPGEPERPVDDPVGDLLRRLFSAFRGWLKP